MFVVGGDLGSGKTLFLTVLAALNPTKKIISNYHIQMKNVEEFDLAKFINKKYSDCLIFLDEAYVYLDSRKSGKNINQLMSYVLFQSRKKNMEIYMTVQLHSSVDIRFRQLTDYFIVARQINVGFEYTIFKPNCPSEWSTMILSFENAMPFMQLYDTNETIDEENTSGIFYTEQQKIDMAKKLCPIIREEFEENYFAKKGNEKKKKAPKTTKSFIKVWLLDHQQPKGLAGMIYDYSSSMY